MFKQRVRESARKYGVKAFQTKEVANVKVLEWEQAGYIRVRKEASMEKQQEMRPEK